MFNRKLFGALLVIASTTLAPMAAVTDLPFRTVCEEFGVGFAFDIANDSAQIRA